MFLKRGRITENSSKTKHKILLLGFFFCFFVVVFCFFLNFLFCFAFHGRLNQVPLSTPIQNTIKMNNENLTWVSKMPESMKN